MGVTNLSCLESKKVSVIYHLSIYLPIIPPSIYFSFFLSSYLNYLFISLSSINIYHISICIFYHLSISHPSTYLPISFSTSSITYLLSIYYLSVIYMSIYMHTYLRQRNCHVIFDYMLNWVTAQFWMLFWMLLAM